MNKEQIEDLQRMRDLMERNPVESDPQYFQLLQTLNSLIEKYYNERVIELTDKKCLPLLYDTVMNGEVKNGEKNYRCDNCEYKILKTDTYRSKNNVDVCSKCCAFIERQYDQNPSLFNQPFDKENWKTWKCINCGYYLSHQQNKDGGSRLCANNKCGTSMH